MLNEVYNKRILELAASIPRLGRLQHPDATAKAHSKLCGSTVTADVKMEGDVVTDSSDHKRYVAIVARGSHHFQMNARVVGAVRISITIRRSSIQPFCAAALTMANSPLTLYAATGTPQRSLTRRMMSR